MVYFDSELVQHLTWWFYIASHLLLVYWPDQLHPSFLGTLLKKYVTNKLDPPKGIGTDNMNLANKFSSFHEYIKFSVESFQIKGLQSTPHKRSSLHWYAKMLFLTLLRRLHWPTLILVESVNRSSDSLSLNQDPQLG